MSIPIHKLTALQVAKLIKVSKQGRHGDGGGLYLQIKGDSATWVFRYILAGRERWMGLGSARDVTVVQARDKAQAHRSALARDEDPLEPLPDQQTASAVTFKQAAEELLANYRRGLRNEKHRAQVGSRLEAYAYPVLGRLPVNRIALMHVEKALKPIWHEKPETANRVRSLIEKVLGFAKVKGWRSGENPAAWKDNLEHVFPPVSALREDHHHAALDHRDLPEFMAELRQHSGIAARALEFLILNNCRTADVIGVHERADKPPLRWHDIDFRECTWTIPKSKASAIGHRKPLTARSMAILTAMRSYQLDPVVVFPSPYDRPGSALSATSLRQVVRKAMGRPDLTVHGFRATFKTWAGEETATPFEVVEASMAHGLIRDRTERAYRRADFFEKRRKLMELWSDYAGSGSKADSKVIRLR